MSGHPNLQRCITLAREALEAGDDPYGAVLFLDGAVLQEDRNRSASRNVTWHPERTLAEWAAENLTEEERARATLYASTEHCPMCAAAHAWAGIGRMVFATTGAQVAGWRTEDGLPPPPVPPVAAATLAPRTQTVGPIAEMEDEIRALFRRCHERERDGASS